MSITAGSAVFSGTGPTQTGQILAQNLGDPAGRKLVGTATVTGDGASSSFTVNFIDGTKDIGFTPSVIICNRVGGAATATIAVVSAVPVDGKTFTVNTSAAVNAATFIVGFVAYK
jgi:hypothetical protein